MVRRVPAPYTCELTVPARLIAHAACTCSVSHAITLMLRWWFLCMHRTCSVLCDLPRMDYRAVSMSLCDAQDATAAPAALTTRTACTPPPPAPKQCNGLNYSVAQSLDIDHITIHTEDDVTRYTQRFSGHSTVVANLIVVGGTQGVHTQKSLRRIFGDLKTIVGTLRVQSNAASLTDM